MHKQVNGMKNFTYALSMVLLSMGMGSTPVAKADAGSQAAAILEILKVARGSTAQSIKNAEDNDAGGPAGNDTNTVWSPPENVEWIQHNFNTSDKLCNDAEGICAGWLETASEECKANYQFGDSAQATQTRLQYEQCVYQMVFKPYISLTIDKVTSQLTDTQKREASRLKTLGWNQPTTQPVEFRVASDIPEPIVQASKSGMLAAIDLLGNYGPLRVYLVGNDVTLAEALVEDFCAFNYSTEQQQYCRDDQGEAIREMAYIYPGGNGFQQSSWMLESPVQSFVHNPYADENNKHSIDEGELNNDRKVNAHEYFHVYQGAHNVYRGAEDDSFGWSTTRWVEEGAAVYFEQHIMSEMGWQTEQQLKTRVTEDLETIKQFTTRFPGVSMRDVDTSAQTHRLLSYCGQLCIGNLQYEFGHIAFQYLETKTAVDKILFEYWSEYTELGWHDAFEKVFDQKVDSFYDEFEAFLLLSVDEQCDILDCG